ncbi:MAG: hypothetical protein R3E31_11670 [Chloroflexota bacterium]|nr:hypothetical protein [Anaerolineales bacterium]MCA9975628.1 hypothetical protein [Anaerolineales bacterium]MCB8965470.1 hypothetical protein [Ardenticatenaceae bacterium]
MEHEEIYVMMMEALDGELADEQQPLLADHLRVCPPCMREWQALLTIDQLFRQTPLLSPAADFTQRTLARLPNTRYRVGLIGAIYMLLLFSGTLPILIGIWAISQYGSVVTQPGVVSSLIQSAAQIVQVIGAVLNALLNGLGEFVVQQPAVLGWLLVMIGIVSVWSGVYRQLIGWPSMSLTRVRSLNS